MPIHVFILHTCYKDNSNVNLKYNITNLFSWACSAMYDSDCLLLLVSVGHLIIYFVLFFFKEHRVLLQYKNIYTHLVESFPYQVTLYLSLTLHMTPLLYVPLWGEILLQIWLRWQFYTSSIATTNDLQNHRSHAPCQAERGSKKHKFPFIK